MYFPNPMVSVYYSGNTAAVIYPSDSSCGIAAKKASAEKWEIHFIFFPTYRQIIHSEKGGSFFEANDNER